MLLRYNLTIHDQTYLEMRACNRFGELIKQRLLDLCKFGRVHDFENVLYFVEEHDFLGAVHLWPIAQKAQNDLQSLAHVKRGITAGELLN